MIYVTHDQVEAMTLADKIVVLRAGRVDQVGAPMELYKDPDNKFVAGFIGSPSMNFLDGVVENGQVRIPMLDRAISTTVDLPADGTAVLVGIRPQHLTISEGKALLLDIRERLGGVAYDYLLTESGNKIIVETHSDEEIPEGSQVTVDFDVANVLLFDAATERRLR
jgi:lactose/L-arabinose transport system ATP-binding protein